MRTVAIASDSHVPNRAPGLPGWVEDLVEDADHLIHPGDFVDEATLEHFRELADGDLTAVTGNMDPSLGLPRVDSVTVEDVTFVVTHGTGDPAGYDDRVVGAAHEEAGDDAVAVAGHTHQVRDDVVDGVRLLNPGSCTGAPPASETSMMTVSVDGGKIDVTVHRE